MNVTQRMYLYVLVVKEARNKKGREDNIVFFTQGENKLNYKGSAVLAIAKVQ